MNKNQNKIIMFVVVLNLEHKSYKLSAISDDSIDSHRIQTIEEFVLIF